MTKRNYLQDVGCERKKLHHTFTHFKLENSANVRVNTCGRVSAIFKEMLFIFSSFAFLLIVLLIYELFLSMCHLIRFKMNKNKLKANYQILSSYVVTLSCSSVVEFQHCAWEVVCTIASHKRHRTGTCPRFHCMAISDKG